MKFLENARRFAPAILRYGLGLVYLWFGISQLIDPKNFIGYLPTFIFNSPYATAFVIANGIFEIIAGILLILGIFTRLVAALLGLHLLAIMFDLGYGDVAVRDFGLAISTLTITLWGEDEWCMEKKWKERQAKKDAVMN